MEDSKADLSEHNDSREGKRRGCWVGGGGVAHTHHAFINQGTIKQEKEFRVGCHRCQVDV